MQCPFCGSTHSHVLESRTVEMGQALRRRRVCRKCRKRFTTYEKTKTHVLWVIKKDGKREPFEKDKIKRGVLRAIEKRPVSLDLVDEIVGRVERQMLRRQKEEVSSRSIGTAVMRKLKTIDKVAWLRFASVYMEFEDLEDFERTIKKV